MIIINDDDDDYNENMYQNCAGDNFLTRRDKVVGHRFQCCP